ncbi:hypothetical protein FB446DRAFT_327955 [Lentinula raphanica]|nr:hypothetical protein FB446DRAFT_327955 [Lentinula raphanica]
MERMSPSPTLLHKTHWSPMGKHFSPPQIINMYIIYQSRIQYWNAAYDCSMQILSFKTWYASVNKFNGEESHYEYWHWASWLHAQGLNVNLFLCPLLIPSGTLIPVTETHPYYCCYSGCHRRTTSFSSKQYRNLHFFTQHCSERTTFRCEIGECVNVYHSTYALRRHQHHAHNMPYPSEARRR